jgi:hypothetical protein
MTSRKNVRVGAVGLEVVVVWHARVGACRGCVVRARAARGAIGRVAVDEARGLAADGEAVGVEGALERRRAVGPKVDGAVGDLASLVVRDPHRDVVTVNEGDIIEVYRCLEVSEPRLKFEQN